MRSTLLRPRQAGIQSGLAFIDRVTGPNVKPATDVERAWVSSKTLGRVRSRVRPSKSYPMVLEMLGPTRNTPEGRQLAAAIAQGYPVEVIQWVAQSRLRIRAIPAGATDEQVSALCFDPGWPEETRSAILAKARRDTGFYYPVTHLMAVRMGGIRNRVAHVGRHEFGHGLGFMVRSGSIPYARGPSWENKFWTLGNAPGLVGQFPTRRAAEDAQELWGECMAMVTAPPGQEYVEHYRYPLDEVLAGEMADLLVDWIPEQLAKGVAPHRVELSPEQLNEAFRVIRTARALSYRVEAARLEPDKVDSSALSAELEDLLALLRSSIVQQVVEALGEDDFVRRYSPQRWSSGTQP